MIVKKNGQFCVVSHTTGKNLGCFKTRKEAVHRLKQIRFFKKKMGYAKKSA